MMFTEKQQEIADRILKDLSAQNFIWESDYMSDLQMQYPQNYHDCDYVMESLIRDYRLLERYGKGYLKLTPEGMKTAEGKFMETVKSAQRQETVKRWTEYLNLANALLVLLGSLLTLVVQWLMKYIL